jgi:hypothetical protein
MKKKILDLIRKGLLQNIFIGIYFIVLAAECYCSFKGYDRYTRINYYVYRIYFRPLLLPILFAVFLQQFISRNHLYIIGAMIASCIADYLIITYSVLYQWIGLGCYALSFILLGLQVFKLEYFSFKTSKSALFISLFFLILYISTKEYFSESHNLNISKKPLTYLYATSLAFLSTAILNLYFNNKSFNFKFALVALFLLVLSNLSFDFSLYVLHRKHYSVDSLSGLSYGLYLFIFIRGLLRAKDKIMGTEYFNTI